jgi:hypothetical protein
VKNDLEQRAQHRMLQAAGDTLSDHGRKLTSMDGRLASLEVLLSNHTQQLFLIHGRLGSVEDRRCRREPGTPLY